MHTSPRKVLGDASNAAPKPRGVKRNPFAHLVGTPAKKPRLDSEPTSPAASPPPPPPEPTTRENSTLAYAHSLARGASIRGLRMPSGSRTRPQPREPAHTHGHSSSPLTSHSIVFPLSRVVRLVQGHRCVYCQLASRSLFVSRLLPWCVLSSQLVTAWSTLLTLLTEAKRGGSNLIASGSIDGHIAIWKADKRQAVDPGQSFGVHCQ